MDDYESFKQRMGALTGAILLFGLAALFLTGAVFPAILLLLWVSVFPVVLAEQGWKYGLWILVQVGIWMAGVFVLIETGQIFPGVLILAGLSALLVAIAPPDKLDRERQRWVREMRAGKKGKRKRFADDLALPLPAEDEDDEIDDADPVWIDDEDDSAVGARSHARRR
jgi:hypothetical protein